ncbi:unnamed protein product [Lactuca saligna]|uniref:Uncharacterized protein n=1 Tax=Lactuca saligna TaxID=75948 RepID=A0AA35Z8K2_LACSI|nr:unnamed protein product [Lactuca saligna]
MPAGHLSSLMAAMSHDPLFAQQLVFKPYSYYYQGMYPPTTTKQQQSRHTGVGDILAQHWTNGIERTAKSTGACMLHAGSVGAANTSVQPWVPLRIQSRQKEGESIRAYYDRFTLATLSDPGHEEFLVTSTFAQGLLTGPLSGKMQGTIPKSRDELKYRVEKYFRLIKGEEHKQANLKVVLNAYHKQERPTPNPATTIKSAIMETTTKRAYIREIHPADSARSSNTT